MDVRPIDANRMFRFLGDFLEGGDGKYAAGKRYAFNVARSALNNPGISPTLSLNTLRDAIYQDAVEHGLWDSVGKAHMDIPCVAADVRMACSEKVMDECNELDHEFRNEDGFKEELADVIIMCMSVAGHLNIDIDAEIRRKMEINKHRSYKHEND